MLRTEGGGYVLLECIGRLEGKTVTKLHVWNHSNLSWKRERAPKQKPVGNFTGQTCYAVLSHDRKGIVPQIGVGVVDDAIGILPNEGKETLSIGRRSNPGCELGLG